MRCLIWRRACSQSFDWVAHSLSASFPQIYVQLPDFNQGASSALGSISGCFAKSQWDVLKAVGHAWRILFCCLGSDWS
jgi:hypothetical protein